MKQRFEGFPREVVGIYWDYKPLCCEQGDFGVYRERWVSVDENDPFTLVVCLVYYPWL